MIMKLLTKQVFLFFKKNNIYIFILAKTKMRDAYKKLENGNFSDSLQYINEILILFSNFLKKEKIS